MNDLLLIVPDQDIEFAMRGIFSQPRGLNIRSVKYDIKRHPQRDHGCRFGAVEFARPFLNMYQYVLIIFDYEDGTTSGKHKAKPSREEIEREVETALDQNGWQGRCGVVVIEPEVEAWIWSDSKEVEQVLGWAKQPQRLRDWLIQEQLLSKSAPKPARPKEAYEKAIRKVKMRKSASIFEELAIKVSFKKCTDPSFNKLKLILQAWFGENTSGGGDE